MEKIYYSPKGYWKGYAAIEKLAKAAKVSEQTAKEWLKKQAIWQIYLPAPKYIPRPKFDVPTPNDVHQADILYLPHDKVKRKTYKYVLTVVDIASRYKEAEPLTSKTATEVADAFNRIYKRKLKWPKTLQVDPGREFMGATNQLLAKHNVVIRRGKTHRDQGIVERFNRTLAERLFGYQYDKEMKLPPGKRSTEWVARLPAVVSAINNEVTRLTGKTPAEAIKSIRVTSVQSTPAKRIIGLNEKKIPINVNVRYLYQPGEQEGGTRRATDPIWSVDMYQISYSIIKPNEPIVYYLSEGAPKRGFVREELMIVPNDTK